ncbi:hypothetical protein ACFVTF_15955 [Kitasatospora sp. NPDC057940]
MTRPAAPGPAVTLAAEAGPFVRRLLAAVGPVSELAQADRRFVRTAA